MQPVILLHRYANRRTMSAVRSSILPVPKSISPKLQKTGMISTVNYFSVDPNDCVLKHDVSHTEQ
jgi:hypothetical protein